MVNKIIQLRLRKILCPILTELGGSAAPVITFVSKLRAWECVIDKNRRLNWIIKSFF